MASYDAVCFDLDSTLCVHTQDRRVLLETAFDRAGCEPFCTAADLRGLVPDLPTAQTDREFYENLFELAARRARGETDEELGNGVDRHRSGLHSDGAGPDPAHAPAIADAFLDAYDPTAVRFRTGAEAALDLARERGPVGLITNGERETQTRKLETLGITDAFDVAVFTDPEAGVLPKPSTVPFERALAVLGAEPSAAIHVGDSVHADVAGANAMGMDSAWVDPGHDVERTHEPTYELPSLDAFERIV